MKLTERKETKIMIANIDPVGGRAISFTDIEKLSRAYDEAAARLEESIAALEADLETAKQQHLRNIRRQAATVAAAEAELHSAVESAPDLFVKPRTVTVHGVKCGFVLSEGKLVFDDADSVLAAIRKYRKDDAESLIRTKSEPNKDSLKRLPAVELARLGCRIEGAGDQVLVKRVAGDVEKLIDKLIVKLVEAMVETEAS